MKKMESSRLVLCGIILSLLITVLPCYGQNFTTSASNPAFTSTNEFLTLSSIPSNSSLTIEDETLTGPNISLSPLSPSPTPENETSAMFLSTLPNSFGNTTQENVSIPFSTTPASVVDSTVQLIETTTANIAETTTQGLVVDIINICQFRFTLTKSPNINASFDQAVAESLAATYSGSSTSTRKKRSATATNGTYTVTVTNSEIIDAATNEIESNYTVTQNGAQLTGEEAARQIENSTAELKENLNSRSVNVNTFTQEPAPLVSFTETATTQATTVTQQMTNTMIQLSTIDTGTNTQAPVTDHTDAMPVDPTVTGTDATVPTNQTEPTSGFTSLPSMTSLPSNITITMETGSIGATLNATTSINRTDFVTTGGSSTVIPVTDFTEQLTTNATMIIPITEETTIFNQTGSNFVTTDFASLETSTSAPNTFTPDQSTIGIGTTFITTGNATTFTATDFTTDQTTIVDTSVANQELGTTEIITFQPTNIATTPNANIGDVTNITNNSSLSTADSIFTSTLETSTMQSTGNVTDQSTSVTNVTILSGMTIVTSSSIFETATSTPATIVTEQTISLIESNTTIPVLNMTTASSDFPITGISNDSTTVFQTSTSTPSIDMANFTTDPTGTITSNVTDQLTTLIDTSTFALVTNATSYTITTITNATGIDTSASVPVTIGINQTSSIPETSTMLPTINQTDQTNATETSTFISDQSTTGNVSTLTSTSPVINVTDQFTTIFETSTFSPSDTMTDQTIPFIETSTTSIVTSSNNITDQSTTLLETTTEVQSTSIFDTSTSIPIINVTDIFITSSFGTITVTGTESSTNQSTSIIETSTFTPPITEQSTTDSLGTISEVSTILPVANVTVEATTDVTIPIFDTSTSITNIGTSGITTSTKTTTQASTEIVTGIADTTIPETTTATITETTTRGLVVDIINICQFRFTLTTSPIINASFDQAVAESLAATYSGSSTSSRKKRSATATNGTYTVTVIKSEIIDAATNEIESNYTVTENGAQLTGEEAARQIENSTADLKENLNSRSVNVNTFTQEPTPLVSSSTDTTTISTVTEAITVVTSAAVVTEPTDLTAYLVEMHVIFVGDVTAAGISETTAEILALHYNETQSTISNRKKRSIATDVRGDFNVSIETSIKESETSYFFNYTLRVNDVLETSEIAIAKLGNDYSNIGKLYLAGGVGTLDSVTFRSVSFTATPPVTSIAPNVTEIATNATVSDTTAGAVVVGIPWYIIVIIVLGAFCLLFLVIILILCYRRCCGQKPDSETVGKVPHPATPPLKHGITSHRAEPPPRTPIPAVIPSPKPDVEHLRKASPQKHVPLAKAKLTTESEDEPRRPSKKAKKEPLPAISPRRTQLVHQPPPSSRMSRDPLVPKFRSTIHPIVLPPINSVIERDTRDTLTEDALLRQRREIERHKNKVQLRRRYSRNGPYNKSPREDIDEVLDPGTPDVFKERRRKRHHRKKGKLNLEGSPTEDPDIAALVGRRQEPTGRYHRDTEASSTDSGVMSPEANRKKMASLLADAFSLISPSAQSNMVGPIPPIVVQPAPEYSRPLMHHPDGRTATPHHRVMTPSLGNSLTLPPTPSAHSSASPPSPANGEVLFTRRQPPVVFMPQNGDVQGRPATYTGSSQSGKPLYITPIKQQAPPGDDSQSPIWTPYRTYDNLSRIQAQSTPAYGNVNYNNNFQPPYGGDQFIRPGTSGAYPQSVPQNMGGQYAPPGTSGAYSQPQYGAHSPLPGTIPISGDLNGSYLPPPQIFQTTLPSETTSSGFEPGTSQPQEPHPSATMLQSIKDELAKLSGRSSTPVQSLSQTEPGDIATRDYGKESEA